MSELTAGTETVLLILDANNSNDRFQVVSEKTGNGSTAPRVVKAFYTQGEAVSWLLGNGYRWVEGDTPRQQWVK